MILQATWNTGIGWDDEIPPSVDTLFRKWLQCLEDIVNVRVPRLYSPFLSSSTDTQLHIFVDASEEAFAAVCYLRVKEGSNIEVSFLCSRGKVAPIKKLTIPRLELQAAVLGTRIARMIKNELRINITSRIFWSDSKTVLAWIRATDKKFNEFVSNRVGEIQEETDSHEWRWIPTKLNVADLATRFDGEISFSPENEWFTGPSFLRLEEEEWPKEEIINESNDGDILGIVGQPSQINPSPLKEEKINKITPNIVNFSTWNRLWRATAAVRACARIWINKGKLKPSSSPLDYRSVDKGKTKILHSAIIPEDLEWAHNMLVKVSQRATFQEEIDAIGKSSPKLKQVLKKGKLFRLSPFLDQQGILRLKGRLVHASDISDEVKYPAILGGKHPIVELLVQSEHEKAHHHGSGTVLSSLQQRYHIISGKESVKRTIRNCPLCKVKRCKPLQPIMGNLPVSRLASSHRPFYNTGIDYFGPLEVTVGRRHEKRYGVLCCCMTTRAVHIEVAHDLSTDEALMALSRFIDTRGRPHTIYSDNGTNFVGAARVLHEKFQEINWEEIMENSKFQEITWRFIPARSPAMGGAWERLVGSVKKCLMAQLQEKYPKDTTLLTFIKSCENIINSRPLLFLSTDPRDPVSICPNDILRGHSDTGPGIPAEVEPKDETLRSQWKRAQQMSNIFWKRWTNEFLPQLLRRDKWHDEAEPLAKGDLVFMVDDLHPRNMWLRGFVSRVFPGKDNVVRVVEVTVRGIGGKEKRYRRACNRVCPLGLRMGAEAMGDTGESEDPTDLGNSTGEPEDIEDP